MNTSVMTKAGKKSNPPPKKKTQTNKKTLPAIIASEKQMDERNLYFASRQGNNYE